MKKTHIKIEKKISLIIGFEIKKEYCELTKNRIEKFLQQSAYSQLALINC